MTLPSNDSHRTHDKRLLIFVVTGIFIANVLQWAVCRALHLNRPDSINIELNAFTHLWQGTDSWVPMMKSLDYFRDHPTLPIYGAHLYDTLIYSLASLLPLLFLRKLGVTDPAMLRLLCVASWLAVVGVAVVSLAMGHKLLKTRSAGLTWRTVLAVALACFTSYPLLKASMMGNAQAFLSFGFIVLLYLWTTGRESAAGVVAALMAFVKPQYGLLLVWMALRRRWGAMAAFAACAAILLTLSIAVFGLHNNLDYLGVLAGLSKKAQTHYANQSMFGTLNRLIFNGENLSYTPNVYTPYIPWVYRTTVLTSLLLVGTVLAFPWARLRGSTADLAAMGLASVAASPMAWEHHYGIVFGIFAWYWFTYGCWEERRPWLWGLSFFLCNNFLSTTNMLAARPGWNILQSYLYFGALLLLALLMRQARVVERTAPAPDAAPKSVIAERVSFG